MLEFTLVDEPTAAPAAVAPAVAPVVTQEPVAEATPKEETVDPSVALQARLANLEAKLVAKVQAEVEPVVLPEPTETVDFYLDPVEAVRQEVRRTLEADALASQVRMEKTNEAMGLVEAEHKDFKAVGASQGFKDFLAANPVAAQLVQDGRTNIDASAINAALTLYKASPKAKTNPAVGNESNDEVALAAESTGNADSTVARPTFSRAELDRMPADEKERRNNEILAAYVEGRVTR